MNSQESERLKLLEAMETLLEFSPRKVNEMRASYAKNRNNLILELNSLREKHNPKRKENKNKDNFIYLMKCNRNNLIKIGISNKPSFREKTLQSQDPSINLIFYAKGDLNMEKFLHSTFSENRIRGEWFDLDNEGIELAKKMIEQFGEI